MSSWLGSAQFFVLSIVVVLYEFASARRRLGTDLSLWIDEQQVREFGGYGRISIIHDGHTEMFLQEPGFESSLPIIPERVNSVNFTWRSSEKKTYFYEIFDLDSYDRSVLNAPTISMPLQGLVPRNTTVFTVNMECVPNNTGSSDLSMAFTIRTVDMKPLKGMPIKFRLRKECLNNVPDSSCAERCANGGVCDSRNICRCERQYMGRFCEIPICYPACLNEGRCVAPGVCECVGGYIGNVCEGGICELPCLNGGKCVQKDICQCGRGYFGKRCEFSKCAIPCQNGGHCIGYNRCRCSRRFGGYQCEMVVGREPSRRPHPRKERKDLFV
ncbi:protein shifted [Galendromus occidentalis]|uniref:Protein shifted n=1 Tax=Galendromus occidentalis TaxID=34638 RepID=A0AAJ6VUW2_9ACAR|nr:protein shifted [Galendromus occidentalis]